MKKFVSIALALMIILSSFTAFAASDEEVLNALFNSKYLSGELDFKMAIKPNAPLPKFIDPDGSQTKILESMKFTYHIKYNASEDSKKAQLEMNMLMSVPNTPSMDMKYWVDMDLSDMEKPVYKIIMKPSDENKYMYMDYANNPMFPMSAMTPAYMNDIGAINNELTKSIDKSKFKPEYKDGKYIIVIDESTVKELCKNVATVMSKYFMNYFMVLNTTMTNNASVTGVIGGEDGPTSTYISGQAGNEKASEEKPNTEAIKAEYEKAVAEFFAKLDKVQLFDKNAIVIESELNDKNLIKNQKIAVNVKTNIAELMGLFGATDAAVTKENSNLDVSLILDFAYSRINEQITIAFPELTKDNSIDIFRGYLDQPRIDTNKINVVVNGQILDFDVEPVMEDNRVLVPVRAFLNAVGINDNDITYQDENISIKRGDTVVNLKVGSNIAVVNGREVALDVPVLVRDGRTLLPVRFIAETFKFDVEWMPFYKGEGGPLSGGIVHLNSKRMEPKLTFMIPSSSETIGMEKLEKASAITGIEANIIKAPIEQYKDRTMLMLAAGEPAVIFNYNIQKDWLEKMAEQGAITPLEDLIEKYAPNIQKYLNENPDFKKSITNKDGHIYIIPVNAGETSGFFISGAVKNPQTAVKLLDYFYTTDPNTSTNIDSN